jgi:hypothetical protein
MPIIAQTSILKQKIQPIQLIEEDIILAFSIIQ